VSEQLELLRTATRGRRPRPVPTAAELPVARVAVDVPLAHLDRPFDYTVPATMAQAAQPGVRVRVRFAGQDVDGFVVDRVPASDHEGRLMPLRRVVSAEAVLTPPVLLLARAVADRYAGTLGDVLRLAVPPRHAEVEKRAPAGMPPGGAAPSRRRGPGEGAVPPPGSALDPVAQDAWTGYPAGPAFLGRLAAGQAPRAVWTALPGPAWTAAVAQAVAVCLRAGRGALVVLPDRRDADALEPALTTALGPGRHARLEADLGPADRYAAFLAVLRGQVPVAIGTRAAAFAPVADLGLVVIWDDGDELHAEPRAPYPHAREVLALRAEQTGAAMLVGGWSRTAEAQQLVETGWAREIDAERATLRRCWPRVAVSGADTSPDSRSAAASARIPPAAWRAVRDGLARGSVLVQVPRAGYLPGLSCGRCRRPARCPACQGPLRLLGAAGAVGAAGAAASPSCGWCGRAAVGWTCPHCGDRRLRARAVGVERTAEELGRAFPGAGIVVSRAERTLPSVPARGALVLATSGVEPPAPAPGYTAAVLLDAEVPLERPDLRAGEEALRRWRAAAALVRPAEAGGLVVICADPGVPAVQALVRGDPAGYAARELAERTELGLPPAIAAATVTGDAAAVTGFLALLEVPPGTEVLGPVPIDADGPGGPRRPADDGAEPPVRLVLRAPRTRADALAGALRAAQAVRSARRDTGAVRVRVDPRDLG
jgi:primosomal protein N' (replication factor Y)